ncbi:hypothetical protein CALVIDRAFT_70959 [Calocera viscosa TUFC12733]|uniref:Uncharacterized protein n=1 Tax=Calocera viscosa (strain TUFC12733) TaxID=1330018 RepID=A0A167NAH2_CALVF|nr:hypothetical protein CALVIDRAFT_70959 [Calocera viscosa TUFC12733]
MADLPLAVRTTLRRRKTSPQETIKHSKDPSTTTGSLLARVSHSMSLNMTRMSQRQRSVLRKKPSKKMQERPKKLPEEEKQRRRSLSAEPVAAAGIPEKRRRGSIDEKERRQHKKLHKKRRSIETGVFAGPDGGPGQIGVPVDYENESSPEEGHAQDNTEEEITSPQATRLTPENQAQDAHEPHIEHPPQATYGASGWAPAVVEAQRSAQAQEGGEPRKGGQSQAQAKGAPYGTDWRTADVPGGARTAEKRNSGSGTLNSPGSPVSPRKRTPSLLRRMRGEAKVVSGRLAMDTGKMEQGRLMKEGYVGGEYNPEPAE